MRIPRATYRLQFTPDFDFAAAGEIVPYLAELGVSDIYASPVFQARAGSTHGYDVVDHTALNPELGGAGGFAALAATVREHGLGWLQDLVPNHMAYSAENPLLVDLFENGAASACRDFFDIDWDHYYENIRGKVLAPFLGRFFGQALEAGELDLRFAGGGFEIAYFDLRFPLAVDSYPHILGRVRTMLRRLLGNEHPDYIQLLGVLYVLKTLGAEDAEEDRRDQVRFVKQTLQGLYERSAELREALDRSLTRLNGQPGTPESFNALEALLSHQWFRLAYWKVATEEINYRRFFSINDLISLRMEEEPVYRHAHGLVLRLLEEGLVSGLRIDHIDGLYDPAGYLQRLRADAPDTYLVVEKILEPDEPLPDWPVEGTTGYEFLNRVLGLLVRPDAEGAFSRLYRSFTRQDEPFPQLVRAKKRLILERHMFGDVNNLAHLVKNIAGRYRYAGDFTMDSLKRALIEILVLYPVYRSYLDAAGLRDFDRKTLETVLGQAREGYPGLANELEFIGRLLLLDYDDVLDAEDREAWRHFGRRLQQFTGPLMAKGFEDTLLYLYNRFIALNEVGGSPERFGATPNQLHRWLASRNRHWPHALSATATHDTKRGEDVRARLAVLSEMPQEWSRMVRGWEQLNRSRKTLYRRHKIPDRNDEYFLYQTLVGTFPCDAAEREGYPERLREYLVKAVREAKVRTAWLRPDSHYEEAFLAFATGLLEPAADNGFLEAFLPFQRRVAHFGMLNGLAQALVKFTAPGVPDIYQGCELWDLSLVDPDNRRPVDYVRRRDLLADLRRRAATDRSALLAELQAAPEDGRIKLYLTERALAIRRRHPELFTTGEYLPLEVTGARRENLFAFARRRGEELAVTVIPRFTSDLVEAGSWPLGEGPWQDTAVLLPKAPAAELQEAFGGGSHPGGGPLLVGKLLTAFPAALLTTRPEP